MTCYYPKKAWRVGLTENGKPRYKITEFDVENLEAYGDDGRLLFMNNNDNWIQIPCGKCIGCRLDQSKEWAQRMIMELQYHEQSWFVTLTYSDEFLHIVENVDEETGVISSAATLKKSDWQEFMKALRQSYSEKYDNKLRFFMCGEYGDARNTMRPHYHAIIFGLRLDDLQPYKRNNLGQMLFNSKWLSDIWKKGHVVIGEVSYETCNYTARYVTKKVNADYADMFTALGLEPEFTLMSRRPGIGAKYFEDHPEIFENKHFYLSTESGSLECKPPRYFRKLLDRDDPLSDFKQENETNNILLSDDRRESVTHNTSYSYLEALKVKELDKLNQINILKKRSDI